MYGNAAAVLRLCVLAILAVCGDCAEAHLRKPTAASVAPPATAEVKAVHTEEGPKHAEAQAPIALSAKVASNDAHTVASSSPSVANLDAQLHDAEDQVQNKEKEMKVQEGLVKEKETEAAKAQKLAADIRGKTTKLRKEADIATEIAQEKVVEAAKAEKQMNSTEAEVTKISAEEREMQRVLNQTKDEELTLVHNISSLKLKEAKAAVVAPASKSTALMSKSVATVHAAANASKVTMVNQEAMQKLVEENKQLKHEKAELERQLSARKVAKEKAKLKQKLKNRLALADRHMKLRKQVLSTHR